jgi:hypothetical protein
MGLQTNRSDMSKKSGGILALALGVVAGAAAMFLSKKENREMVKREAVKAGKKAKVMGKEFKKNPKKFIKKEAAVVKKAVIKGEKAVVKAAKSAASKLKKKK